MTDESHLDPTQEQGREFFTPGHLGQCRHGEPAAVPSHRRLRRNTGPGAGVRNLGRGGPFLIGPADERWDAAMLVRQSSVRSFMAFASNQDYLAGIGHRTAALEDSRLLPLVEEKAWRLMRP